MLGTLQISLAHHISKKDTTCACNTKTENGTNITDNHNQRIGSNCICAKMPEDHRIHGKTNTPGNIIAKSRQGKPYKIAEQQLIFNKHIPKIQPYIFTEGGNDKTCDQLHGSGKRGSNGNTSGSKFWSSEKAEDKCCVQKDIQPESQHIHGHADSHPPDTSKDSQINLRHTPADIGDTHNADIRRTYGQKFRVIGEQFHHHLRHGKRNQSHKNRDDHGKTKCNSLNDLNGFVIPFSVILGTKQGSTCTKTVVYHEQDIGIICCQGNCGDG